MKYIVINRDCDEQRMNEFTRHNEHVSDIRRFSAIDGNSLNMEELIESNVIAPDISYKKGALGSAMSHVLLWNSVADYGETACIFEDDAILCRNFVDESQKVLSQLGNNWDIVLWGNNYDTSVLFGMGEGRGVALATFSQDSVVKNSDKFKKIDVSTHPFRLFRTLGICGYAISPQGARKLTSFCIPLQNSVFFHSQLNRFLQNTSIDHVMTEKYKDMDSYICIPPLCITENSIESSTILNS